MSNPTIASVVARGGGTNTLNSKTVPIIFVPGVMGSRLELPNGQGLWDPDNTWVMLNLLTASATVEGQMLSASNPAVVMKNGSKKANLTAEQTERGWGGLAWDFYGNGLHVLQNPNNWKGNLCNVYAFGYDWRQSNAVSGANLKKFIADVIKKEKGAKKVIIVTHSMGGLVTRWACKNGAGSSVLGVVHVVQPAVGAVVAYRRFKTGAVKKFNDGDWGLTTILGNTASKYQRVACGLVGPMELLPSNQHPMPPSTYSCSHWLITDAPLMKKFSSPPANVYNTYRDTTGQVGLFKHSEDAWVAKSILSGLKTAENFHNGLKTWFHNPSYVIAVNGYKTDVTVNLKTKTHFLGADTAELNELDLELTRNTHKAGDSTVPIGSQTVLKVPAENQHIFKDAKAPAHADVFSSTDVNKKVIEFVTKILFLP